MSNFGKSGYENDDITHHWGPQRKHNEGSRQKESDEDKHNRFFKLKVKSERQYKKNK